ncbi:Rap1-interacting factor 1 N terminal-domain-containing protein [Hyaloscypha sp. PMI_1271]|nr:Rap1-interacting factor 1 N terminal-domain-containing protein [Hyaloscypha sp. PMI_1271]
MVEPAPVSTLPPLLPAARPPTPPRESNHGETKSSNLIGRFFQKESSSRRSSTNSNFTPESSAESPSQPAGVSSRKKVGFAAWTEYSEPPEVSFDGKGQITHAVQRLPPSAERKPSKSILKPSNGSHEEDYSSVGGSTKLLPPHHHATFATMLESIVQQLAGKDRSSKQDAYLMLSGSLKASDNVPDMKALKEKMPLLCQFIWRDLSEKLENGNTDSTLVTKALVLLSSFLQKPSVAETFPTEFPMHIVDHAIKALEDGHASKDILKHLMFVLAQQNFSPKIMNQERTGRLIFALHQIESHVKGKSIIMGRLEIYRTLLRQSKPHMLSNTTWVPDLFTDMMSTIREIRTSAITFGLESSLVLGRERNASRAVSNLFEGETTDEKDGPKFADFYASKLRDVVKNKEDNSSTVPQIFSVLILFLRHKPQLLEQWAYLNLFLGVLQHCFNSSDSATKMEANYAWNRLVYAILPSDKTPPNVRGILSRPLIAQLKRSSRKATMSSVCNLLYYSLRPNSPPAQLDMYWDEYVVSIVGQCLVAGMRSDPDLVAKDATDACNILHGLFEPTTIPLWTESRAMENFQQNNVDPKALPALDSKWLRKSYSRVFPVLGPLLEKLYWDLGEDSDVARLWEAYVASIASPMRQEVKVSIDTMGCVASLFSLLHKIWNLGPKNVGSLKPCKEPALPQSTSAFLRSFEKLVSTAISGLGLLAFTEKLLCITQDTFIAIVTPSQHPKKPRGITKPPIQHLILLLVNLSPNLEYDLRFSQMVRNILRPFFESRTSRKSRIDLIRDLLPLLPAEGTVPCRLVWQILAEFAAIAVDTRDEKDVNRGCEQPLGVEYREVVSILEVGISISPNQPLPRWNALLGALATSATLDAGDAGRAIAVIEPLAKSFFPAPTITVAATTGLAYLHSLVGQAVPYPRDRQALDAARRRLWGTDNAGFKSANFDPYVHLYEYIQNCLIAGYDSLSKQNHHDYAVMISSVTALLDRCPIQLSLIVLIKIQKGLSCWIVDGGHKVIGDTPLSQSVITLWATVIKILPKLPTLYSHTKVLGELEPLICSGLESKHKYIVNKSIQLWNSVFGNCRDGLKYPELVKAALLRLRPIADIQLPSLHESVESEPLVDQRQPADFTDSQDESSNYSGVSSLGSAFKQYLEPHLQPSVMRRIRQSTPQVIIQVGGTQSRKRSREATPETSNRKSRKRDVTPRLRHDDSQVQFEAIESSPMADRIVDSQLLTDKQKEVKERQQVEAAMFPDLRSNPLPKAKSVERSVEDPELPMRRSSSKIRAMLSPNVLRQTTPTLVLPSDDDNQVPSSPTPTRSLRGDIPVPDPPSSPPEPVQHKSADYSEGLTSSPPEVTPEPDNNTTMSLGPSAQVDPYAVEISTRTISMVESKPVERGSSPVDPSAQLQATEAEYLQRIASLNEQLVEERVEPALDPATNPQLPDTPPRNGTEAPPNQQTPRTPQFVDARSSPASSDKMSTNGDLFEDAFSSPRLNIPRIRLNQSSSPLGDADDSSVLRLVAEYDEGSGHVGRQVSFVEEKNKAQRKRTSPAKQISSPAAPSPRKLSLRNRSTTQSEDKEPSFTSQIQGPSSDPSRIPETPAARPNEISMKIVIDGEEFDQEDTIVVDTSSLERLDSRPTAKRGGAPKKLTTYANNKRKLLAEDKDEVPDSQEVEAAVEKKRKRRLAEGTSEILPTTEDVSTPDEDINMAETADELAKDAGTAGESIDEATDSPVVYEIQAASPDIERFEETIIHESTFKDESSPAPETSKPENNPSAQIIPATTSEPELLTLESIIKTKLASLIDDLTSAALSREGTRDIEDLFYDAKEQLYGAERRGRQRERSEMNM